MGRSHHTFPSGACCAAAIPSVAAIRPSYRCTILAGDSLLEIQKKLSWTVERGLVRSLLVVDHVFDAFLLEQDIPAKKCCCGKPPSSIGVGDPIPNNGTTPN
eukprot:CAMPEP_0171301258 /NCGR_PEP_ID=MMETSP0816-20121228/10406_1 /TAXON_ID=420281 /ORGANISM="Proboscia inermis, Strain CCAP1064/1" /LENGTH=101 /DNA_ID=CAMNT_0011778675 /DNA_START=249 /DNA_END=554 /DNA_ORIENTATION=-